MYKTFHDVLYTLSTDLEYLQSPSKNDLDALLEGLGTQWSVAVSPAEDDLLRHRLEIDRLGPQHIERLVRTLIKNEQSDHTESSSILTQIIQVLETGAEESDQQASVRGRPQPFEDIWQPVVQKEIAELKRNIVNGSDIPKEWVDSLSQGLAFNLIDTLCSVSIKIFYPRYNSLTSLKDVLIRHVRRKVSDLDISTKIYKKFVADMQNGGMRDVFAEYPVYAKYVEEVVSNWRVNAANLICRTYGDRHDIADTFDLADDYSIIDVQFGLGDTHNKGQSVAFLSILSRGSISKVVYKPKDLFIEKAYNDFLLFLNNNSRIEDFKTLAVLPFKEYGYVEYIDHKLCGDAAEVEHFYWNLGRLSSVLFVLRCSDCHKENILASGTTPILLDVETLLEAKIVDQASIDHSEFEDVGHETKQRISESVLQSGLLPFWDNLDKAKYPVDVSVLGCCAPDEETASVTEWIDVNTDGMYLGSISRICEIPQCLPVGVGGGKPYFDHIEAFIDGFRKQSLEIVRLKKDLLAEAGPMFSFKGLTKRIVIRPTASYFRLRELLLTPEACSNSIKQGLVLEVLSRSYINSLSQKKTEWALFKSEVAQLSRLDIPAFYHLTDGTSIFADSSYIADFSDHGSLISGLDQSLDRITHLDEEEITFQIELIRSISQASRFHDSMGSGFRTSSCNHCSNHISDDERIMASVQQLDSLRSIAIKAESEKHVWVGMDLLDDGERFRYTVLGNNIYSGIAGVALLETILEKDYDQNWITHEYIAQIKYTALDKQRLIEWWTQQSLGLAGCGGILITLYLIGSFNQSAKREIENLIDLILSNFQASFLEEDLHFDIIGGSAGLIGALLLINSPDSLRIAEDVSSHLINNQQPDGSWKPIKSLATPFGMPDKVISLYGSEPGLLGFAHGVVGIATALKVFGTRRHNEDSCSAADRGLRYLKSFFCSKTFTWPELRAPNTDSGIYTTTWCHGTSGILFALSILSDIDAETFMSTNDLNGAINRLVDEGIPVTDHLCCGSLGITAMMKFLSKSSLCSKELSSSLLRRISDIEAQVLADSCSGTRFRTLQDMKGGILQPGLFTGNSGIGTAIHPGLEAEEILKIVLSCGLAIPG